jgi:hypothetical protein
VLQTLVQKTGGKREWSRICSMADFGIRWFWNFGLCYCLSSQSVK